MRNVHHKTYRTAHRSGRRRAIWLQRGKGWWGQRPNPIPQLCFLVQRILKFHESDPVLARTIPRSPFATRHNW